MSDDTKFPMVRPFEAAQRLRMTRRGLLAAAAVGSVGFATASGAQELPLTPQCDDGGPATTQQTGGPFYRALSPDKDDMAEPGSKAERVELTGFVLTRGCNPLARAVVDLWHADENGAYDEKGFRYRGRVYTDEKGRYRIRTIRPALYPGRTRHYHAKVAAGGQLLLTTQLYFPGEAGNARDGLFRKELLMRVSKSGDAALAARFDFVVALASR